MKSGSEIELQSQLNKSGIACRLWKSPCTIGVAIVDRAATYTWIKVRAVVSGRAVEEKLAGHKLRIVMVPHIEKLDRKSTRLNSSHQIISYAVFCLKKKINTTTYI